MALQYSVAVRNAQLNAWEATIGTSPILHFYDGVNPANTAAVATANIIATGTMPLDWSAAAAAGSKTILNGPFSITGVAAAGVGTNVVAYRIMDAADVVCHEQGTVTITAGAGDFTMDNVNIANLQVVNVNTMTRTAGNA